MHELEDRRFVITGASGWIGHALIDHLANEFGRGWESHVIAFGSRAGEVNHVRGALPVRALESIGPQDVEGATVFHLAYLTKERLGESADSTYISANLAIDERLLNAMSLATPSGLFVASSGAAKDAERGVNVNLYGLAKLIQEAKFLSYAQSTGIRTIVGRLYNLAGPHINKLESYALSSFIVQGLSASHISISAGMPVYRSYLHVMDAISVVIERLLSGPVIAPKPMDICGPLMVELDDVANGVARMLALGPGVIGRDPIDFSRPNIYLGDPTQFRALALAQGRSLKTFEEQINDTIRYIRGLRLPK